jgi:Aspartyl protease
MRSPIQFVLLCVLVSGPSGCQGRAAIPSPSSPAATQDSAGAAVPFDLYDGYVIVAHGSAGPLKGLSFFIDTGTSPSILDAKVARELHLHNQSPANVVSLSGNTLSREAILPSLALGPVERSSLPVMIGDLSPFRKILPVRIDAIVGMDVLGQSAFIIDYPARVIRFERVPRLSVSVPLRLDHGLITCNAEIDHAPVNLVFDTGTSSVVLFEGAAPSSRSSSNPASAHQLDSVGVFARRPANVRTVRLGKEEFPSMPVIQFPGAKQPQLDFDGLMSPAALGISRFSVDLRDGVLSFSR